jgi:myxalamid-type polyketide synthase MxaC
MNDLDVRLQRLSPEKLQLLARELERRERALRASAEPIAIVGMGCRFPGGASPAAFWATLREGVDLRRAPPRERYDIEPFYDPDLGRSGRSYARLGYFIDDVDQFDAALFGISGREAKSMDPQQRILLEVTHEALEHAGIAAQSLAGSDAGVFLGAYGDDYLHLQVWSRALDSIDAHTGTGTSHSVACGRVSHWLGVHGPSIALDTACSSSLVALHLACESLRRSECSLALAAGVSLCLSPEMPVSLSRARMLAADGRSKTFDASADGYGRGEGCGVLVLKRLSDAVRERHTILALIRGSALNHDGRASTLTAPNGLAQEAVLRSALAKANLTPEAIDFVEAHGTGTPLGDPIEVQALAAVFGDPSRGRDGPLLVGSVKANVGHLEAAAGVAGVIKVVVALLAGELPAQMHVEQKNPHIEVPDSVVRVVTERTAWPRSVRPRVAGVSSFGFGGSNAHVIISEAPSETAPEPTAPSPNLLTLSAQTETGLATLASRFENHLGSAAEQEFRDICFTAAVGRDHHRHRLAISSATTAQAQAALSAFREGRASSDWLAGSVRDGERPVFLFTGQGAQYAGMGGELLASEPAFQEAFKHCAELARPHLERDLFAVVYGEPEQSVLLQQTQYAQPALFALEYALAALWRTWGIEPAAVAGHSVGEYVAACLAEVFDLETAIRLVCARGRLMGSLPKGGAMAAVHASEAHLRTLLAQSGDARVSLAAFNGPETVVISGPDSALNALLEVLEREGIDYQRLQTSHAFHSALMDPILEPFEREVHGAHLKPPRIPLVSNTTGALATDELTTPAYYRSQLREPVRFHDAMRTLRDLGHELFLEIGPSGTLSSLASRSGLPGRATWLTSLKRGQSNAHSLRQAAAALYVRGCSLRLSEIVREGKRGPVPSYPFQRARYWLESAARGQEQLAEVARRGTGHPLIGRRVRLANGPVLFCTTLQPGAPAWLTDHRLLGRVVVPGACYAAMLLVAAREALAENSRLSDLVFPQPMVLAEHDRREVQITLEEGKARVYASDASDASLDPPWVCHAEAVLRSLDNRSSAVLDRDAVEARCSMSLSGADFYSRMADAGFGLGRHFQWIEQVGLGSSEAFARMRAPHEDELAQYPYVPGFLDACFQLLAAAVTTSDREAAEGSLYVPLSVDSIAIVPHAPGPRWAHVRARACDGDDAQFEGDITIYDQAGTAVLAVEGLRVRRATSQMLSGGASETDLYRLDWHSLPFVPGAQVSGAWLVVGSLGQREQQFVRLRRALGNAVFTLSHAVEACPEEPNDGAELHANLDDPAATARAIAQVADRAGPFAAVLFFGEQRSVTSPDAATRSAGRALHVAQAAVELAPASGLWFVTRGSTSADAEAVTDFASGALHGLGKVIAAEHPSSWGGLIDLDPHASGDDDLQAINDALGSPQPHQEKELSYRSGKKLAARLRRVALASGRRALSIRAEGTYLITGALGGIGLCLARWLVEHGAKNLVLNGRSAPSAAGERELGRLERAGARIELALGDIAEPGVAAHLVELSKARGALLGVFHAAGVLDDGIVLEQTQARFSHVFSAKVIGALNLHQATLDIALDYFVLFSSAAAWLGAPGQANYAAANATLDGFARWRRGQGLAACSVAWGPWAGVGMAAGKPPPGWGLIEAFSVDDALGLLTRALECDLPAIAALRAHWPAWSSRLAQTPMPLLSELVPLNRTQHAAEVSQLSVSDLASAPEENWQQMLALKLQAELARVLHVEATRIDIHQRINALGLDSLMSVELKNKIEVGLGVRVSVAELLKGPTLYELAEHLLDLLDKVREAEPQEEGQEQQPYAPL